MWTNGYGRTPALFPQVVGDAYRMVETIRAIDIPRLVATSRFGTMSMWDWEIGSYLHAQGINTISPFSLDQTRKICRALAVKRERRGASRFRQTPPDAKHLFT